MKLMLFKLLRFTGIPFLLRNTIQMRNVTIAMYHDPKPEYFEKHIILLKKLYSIIDINQFIDAHRQNRIDKLPKKALILTFDDGHKNNILLLDIIKKHQLPVTIFLTSGLINTNRHFWFKIIGDKSKERIKMSSNHDRLGYLSENHGFKNEREYCDRQALNLKEINIMKPYVNFQSHTISHPILTMCSDDESSKEIYNSKLLLEKKLDKSINGFAYPNGDYGEREVEFSRSANYNYAVSVDPGYNSSETNLFKLKRLSTSDNSSLTELIVKISGLWWFLKDIRKRIK